MACNRCKQKTCCCTLIFKNTTTQAINREAVFQSLVAGDNITLTYNTNNGTTLITAIINTIVQSTVNPTLSDIPINTTRQWKNTTSGELRQWSNDNGVLKSILLT